MSGRDANQLAADVRAGIFASRPLNGLERDHDDHDHLLDVAVTALDELVGLVGTLQQERDAAWAVDRHGFQLSEPRWSILEIERWLLALGADEELRAAMAGAFRAEAAEAALTTTRQALTEIASLPDQSEDWHQGDVAVVIARRALAATEEQT